MRFSEFKLTEKASVQQAVDAGMKGAGASEMLRSLGFDVPSFSLAGLPSTDDNDTGDGGDEGSGFNGKVFVVGDSLAVGIQKASGAPGTAVGGKNAKQVLEFVQDLVNSGNINGSLVILSSGAANSTYERPNGEFQEPDFASVANQLELLKRAGAVVVLVGNGSKQSKWIKNKYGTYRVNFEKVNMNEQLGSLAKKYGAKFLGPLEQYDSTMNTTGDGIHVSGSAYKAMYQAALSMAGPVGSKKAGGISKGSSGAANTGAIQSYLSSKGLDSNQVAGIMANIKHESNFNPGAIGDGGTSGGLFQHHAERFSKMKAAAGSDWQKNWKGQIDFALNEPAGQQYKSLKFTSPEQATKWWTINFEIPANKYAQADIRSRSASQYA